MTKISHEIDGQADRQDDVSKVTAWLDGEGYPGEFRTASIFNNYGFDVRQGVYTKHADDDKKREIDVVASLSAYSSESFIRISNVIECKWSRDKPWVVFTSSNNGMVPSALIAQTVASQLGESCTWTIAGSPQLAELSIFQSPSAGGGFGGRQAFSKNRDVFYNAVQSVISNCHAYVAEYDQTDVNPLNLRVPEAGAIAFPVIVVDGKLFRASFGSSSDKMSLEEASSIRCHWRGSLTSYPIVTVDIVTMEGLNDFVHTRAQDIKTFIGFLQSAMAEIEACFAQASLEPLTISKGPRGYVGYPPLLRRIDNASLLRSSQNNPLA